MKKLFIKPQEKPSSQTKEKKPALYSLPREVWMVDLKKASDYSGELPRKKVEGRF